jgi:hypothetical protein
MFASAIAERRRAMRLVGMPACPQGWARTVLRGTEKHQNQPALRRPEAFV